MAKLMNIILIIFCLLLIVFLICSNKDNFSKLSKKGQKIKSIIKDEYNSEKCLQCIKKNRKLENNLNTIFCTHCGGEHLNINCIPPNNLRFKPSKDDNTNQDKPNNCISKELPFPIAQNLCIGTPKGQGDATVSEGDCILYSKQSPYRTDYMNKECGDDYYCSFNTGASCGQEFCNLSGPNKYYDALSHCFCTRPESSEGRPFKQGGLPDNLGRVCKLKGCKENAFKGATRQPLEWQAKYIHKWNLQMPLAYDYADDSGQLVSV